MRILFDGLGSISEDGLSGSDRYVLNLWPMATGDLRVIKQWQPET